MKNIFFFAIGFWSIFYVAACSEDEQESEYLNFVMHTPTGSGECEKELNKDGSSRKFHWNVIYFDENDKVLKNNQSPDEDYTPDTDYALFPVEKPSGSVWQMVTFSPAVGECWECCECDSQSQPEGNPLFSTEEIMNFPGIEHDSFTATNLEFDKCNCCE